MPTVQDATPERWDDLLAVFGSRGDPPRCWCQWFRQQRPGYAARTSEQRRADLETQVAAALPPGVLGYDDAGTPSGWCAVALRADYPRLLSYPVAAATADEDGLWAVTCFVVRVGKRRQGFAEVLLEGAVDLARRHGARMRRGLPAGHHGAHRVRGRALPRTAVGLPPARLHRGRHPHQQGPAGGPPRAVRCLPGQSDP